MLRVKLLEKHAKVPTVAHPGEDLAYDIYCLEDSNLVPGLVNKVRTGISVRFTHMNLRRKFGLVIKDRSSMASKGVFTHAGVVDEGYTGEVLILMTSLSPMFLEKGQRVAQMIPTEIFTDSNIVEVDELEPTSRGSNGFGSTGS